MTGTHNSPFTGTQIDSLLTKIDSISVSATQNITRSATFVIAASNSTAVSKVQADYVCDGIDDEVQIQAALDAAHLLGGGEVKLLEGTFNIYAEINFGSSTGPKNVILKGTGRNTILKAYFAGKVLSVSNQNIHNILRDLVINCNNTATHGIYTDDSVQAGNRDIRLQNVIIKFATTACIEWAGSNDDGLYVEDSDLWSAQNAACVRMNQTGPFSYFTGVSFFVATGGTGAQLIGGSAFFDRCLWTGDGGGGTKAYYIDAHTSVSNGQVGTLLNIDRSHFESATFSNVPIYIGNSSTGLKWESVSIVNNWIGCATEYCIKIECAEMESGEEPNTNQVRIEGNAFKKPQYPSVAYIYLSEFSYNVTILNNAYNDPDIPIIAGAPHRALVDNVLESGQRLRYIEGSAIKPLVSWGAVPAIQSSTGFAGQVAYDSDSMYVCTDTDSWASSRLTTMGIKPCVRSSTIVVAASNSSDASKASADYVCDGTNDQTDIIAAMAALPTGGGKIYLTEGTFNINAIITPLNYVHIQGAGMYQTILKGTATLSDSVLKRAATTTPAGSAATPIIGLVLSDFTIDGSIMLLDGVDGAPGGTWGGGKGTYLAYLQNCNFRNLYIHDTPASGLGNDYHQQCTYENCIVINAGRGEPVGTGGSPGGHGFGIGIGKYEDESLMISNCYAKGCFFSGFAFESVDAALYSKYYTFSNCNSTENDYGFLFQSGTGKGISNAKILGGCAWDNVYDGVHVSIKPKNVTIADMDLYSNGRYGIQVSDPASDNVIIHDCRIHENVGYGITTQCGKLNVHDNQVFLNGKTGIFIHGDVGAVSRINVSNNQVYNNGTAAVDGHNDGIRIHPSDYSIRECRVVGNRCFDDQETKTQRYGVGLTSDSDYIYVVGNDLRDNLTGNILNTATGSNNIVIDGTQ